VRADFISATLGGYAEQGSSAELLNYDQMRFNATSGAVLEYGLTRGTGALQAQTIRAALRVPF